MAEEKAAKGHHGNKRRSYVKVFFALIILTILELAVVKMPIARGLIISALIALAVAKAAAVALWFMHLKEETKTFKWMVGGCLLALPPLYAIVLIAEAVVRGGFHP